MEARPRVWWHWMNGNVTEDGIAKGLAWMKRVGIGGLQNFDVDLETPQTVDKRLVYMTPEWKKAFRFAAAAAEADRLGLELAIAASPGRAEPELHCRHEGRGINRDALFNAVEVQDGEVVAKGGARYRTIQLGGSSHRMTLPTLRRLAYLVEAGATLVGKAPLGSPSLNDDPVAFAALVARLWSGTGTTKVGAGQIIASAAIDDALAGRRIAPDLVLEGRSADGEVLFVHRLLGDGDVWFLNNRKAVSKTFEARFRVTGKQPELWHADTGQIEAGSYRVDVAAAVRKGANTLEVKVANLWVNRLIGDAQQGASRITFTAIPTYRADAPLRRSGLIGPVTLEGANIVKQQIIKQQII